MQLPAEKKILKKTARFHADFYSRIFKLKNAPKKDIRSKLRFKQVLFGIRNGKTFI
jgi:hypothetical protein